MALKRVWIPSPNYSSRGGSSVRLIVLHTAEGARTIESLGNFFKGNVQASSHVGADDKVNTIGEYVKRPNKAWTCAEFNPVAIQIELCGFASWSTNEWRNNHANMLDNCAKWIAEEAAYFGLPITKLNSSQAQGSGRGVCQHVDLGSRGGGHHDCGSGFPMDYVLDLARGGATPKPEQEEGTELVASALSNGGVLHVFWADKDKRTVRYRYQRSGETQWRDGGVFAKTSKDIAGLSATLTATGTLEVFAAYADGSLAHTWQNKSSTSWAGGAPGKQVAAFTAVPGG
jgi:hypothetical protein